ncbi:MAG: amidase family protein, partial [Gaiellales bacterium]
SGLTLRSEFEAGRLSPVEVTRELLGRIEVAQPRLNAFVTVTADLALEQAAAAERAYAEGDAGPLAGVPVSIKDLIEVRGVRCTLGSLVDPDRVSSADDPLAERVRAAGAVILGKTNTPEYGWKGETTNRVVGSTHNPWRHGLTAGGSSGGAAAAVAAGLGPLAQGGDGAGSIRIPAAFSGVFGIKPTTGLVPQPTNSGLSSQGPLTRSVADAALLLEVMAQVPLLDHLDAGVAGCRAAWSADLGYAAAEPAVIAACEAAAGRFADLGCTVDAADPGLDDPWPIVETIWAWNQAKDETEATLDLIDQGRRAVVERGWQLSEAEHERVQAERELYATAMQAFFDRFDLLLTPTLPITAFPAGLDQPGEVAGRPTEYLSWTAFTYPFNVSGQPAASVPCGFVDGLPVGLQIVGRRGADALVLRAARAFEQLAPWPFPATDLV